MEEDGIWKLQRPEQAVQTLQRQAEDFVVLTEERCRHIRCKMPMI